MAQTLKEIGNTGLAEFSGQIHEDFLRELRGAEGYKRYNEMRLNSAVVGALLLRDRRPRKRKALLAPAAGALLLSSVPNLRETVSGT